MANVGLAHAIEIAKERFVAFRGGSAFLWVLCAFLVSWFAIKAFLPFDPDNSILNIILSAEASVATCLLLDFSIKNMASDRATFNRILTFEERIIAIENTILNRLPEPPNAERPG